MIFDEHNKDEDIAKANYCLFRNSVGFKSAKSIWSLDKMNKYIKLVQSVFTPYLTDQAEELFKAYYTFIKISPIIGKERKTVRMLESMIRLGQAHARLMFRNEITTFDAISVILLLETGLMSGLVKENYAHTRYTNDRDYFELKVEILQRLKLVEKRHENLLWANMKNDVAKRSRTPSPVANYIEDADINNLMASEILTEDFSSFSSMNSNLGIFSTTQPDFFIKRQDRLIEIEEEKIAETSQKVPSIGTIDLDDED